MDVMTASPTTRPDEATGPVAGYDPETVDDFLRAVSEEQARLRARIEAARVRERRALALIGLHEAMVVTMHGVYREVTTRRRIAEATAAGDDPRRGATSGGDPVGGHAMTTPLVRPQVRSVVPESVVEGLIGDADQQISALEEQVALAAAAAADAEARLAELGLDERSSAWAAIQLKRFVVSLRADAERDAGAIVAEARAHARRLVEDAIADDAMAAVESQRAHDARFERPTPAARPVASPLPEVTDLTDVTDVTDGDAIFRAITPESLGALDQSVPIGPDAAFWAAEPDRRRRFTRRAMATQGLALVLVLTAAFVRFV